MKLKVILIPVVILILGFIAMQTLLSYKTDPPRTDPVPRSKIVEAVEVNLESIPAEITAFGRSVSVQPVILNSEVSGIIMEGEIPFQPAQEFRKGDLLLRIDDRQIKLDINSTKSDFLNALAIVLPEIKVDFPKEYEIWQEYFNSCDFDHELSELPEAGNQKIKMFLSRFNVYKLYFTVRNLEIRLSKHYIYAPFDGSIVSTQLRVGSTAQNGTRLGEIINLEDLEVEVPVPAEDIRWINRKRPVVFTSTEIEGSWTGRIKRIGKTIDTRTQTVQVYISVNQSRDRRIYDGVFLKARIPGLDVENAMRVPRKALYNEQFVYLIEDGKLDFREVEISRKETNSVLVTGGLQDGDTLVLEVLQGVAQGMPASAKRPESEGGITQ